MYEERFMRMAIEEAKLALKEGEVPVGAVVVKDGVVIGKGHNKREAFHDISSHAEIEAVKEAEEKLRDWRLDGAELYVTLEPCLMCSGAILQARIGKVVFGAFDEKDGAVVSRYFVFDSPSIHPRPLVFHSVLKDECQKLLSCFFEKCRKETEDKN